jgi:hypothetical protein
LSAAFADRAELARRLGRLRMRGIVVGWGTLLVGLHGFGWVDRQVSAANAIAVALDTLEQNPDDDLVLALACLRESETGEVVGALERLAEREGADYELERRKWRLLLLEERIEALPADPLHGLLDLDEFWGVLGYPEDGPHTVQTRSGIPPEDYYTQDNYEAEFTRHGRWMEQEARLLRQADAVDAGAELPDVS